MKIAENVDKLKYYWHFANSFKHFWNLKQWIKSFLNFKNFVFNILTWFLFSQNLSFWFVKHFFHVLNWDYNFPIFLKLYKNWIHFLVLILFQKITIQSVQRHYAQFDEYWEKMLFLKYLFKERRIANSNISIDKYLKPSKTCTYYYIITQRNLFTLMRNIFALSG